MEEQLKVLKVMSEVTSRIDMNAFAQMVGLNPHQILEDSLGKWAADTA
jgi:hypothetical protein